MTRPAGSNEVRKYYKDQGFTVRISPRGHVLFRGVNEVEWREGRFVSEYRVDPELGVFLP